MQHKTPQRRPEYSDYAPCSCIDAMVMGSDMCMNCCRVAEYNHKLEELERRRKLVTEMIPDIRVEKSDLEGWL